MTLPQGWVETTIGEAAIINPKHDPATDRNKLVSFVPMPSVDEHLGAIVENAERTLADIWTGYTHFADGDVIFAKITPCMENGKAAIARSLTSGLACGSTEFYVMRPADGVSADYLWRFVRQRSFRTDAERRMTGAVGQRRVPREYLENHRFPLPPAPEQRRIVAKLDALTARLDRARAELDRVPVLARRIREEVLNRAATGALAGRAEVSTRPADDWIDSTFYGPRFSKEDYVSDGIPTVRTTDFNENGTMRPHEAPKVTCSEDDYARWGCRDGDLLVTRTGSIGKCAIYEEAYGPVLPSAYLIRVRFRRGLSTRFAWMMFASPMGQNHLGVNSRAVTQPNINAAAIRSLPIPDLSPEERAQTIELVDQACARANRLEAEAARARALIDRLESAILAKAFRGELVPQDPNDEPASMLLDRIRAERAAAPKAKRGRRAKADA